MHSNDLKGSFHDAIGPVLQVAQVFGLMPVDGVASKNISNTKFRWKSLKTIYSLLFLSCGTIELLLCLSLMFENGMSLEMSRTLFFMFISMISAFFFFKTAMNWENLMKLWFENEKVFLKFPYTIRGSSLKRRIRLWAVLVGILTLCNETLS